MGCDTTPQPWGSRERLPRCGRGWHRPRCRPLGHGSRLASVIRWEWRLGSLSPMFQRRVSFLVVLAGVLAGHAIMPALFHSHGALAHSALHSHGWQPVLVAMAAVAGFAGLARAVWTDADRGPLRFGSLVPFQVLAFLLVELVELRGSVAVLVQDPGFWLGVLLQLGLAAGAVLLVRVGRRILEAFPRPVPVGRLAAVRLVAAAPRPAVASAEFLTERIVRGPPAATGRR